MSILNPDEVLDTHVDEPMDDTDFEMNNANEVDDEFVSQPRASLLLPGASGKFSQASVTRGAVQDVSLLMALTGNVVNSKPFDLDVIRSSYEGYGLIKQLLFIANCCPALQREALIMLINYVVQNTSSVQVYLATHHRLEALRAVPSEDGASASTTDDLPRLDSQWIDTVATKSQARLDMLMTDFKRQKEDGLKEAVRHTMHELFEHYVSMGQLQDAIKLYSRAMREYCTSPKHVIEMLIDWIEVTIHLDHWHRVDPLLNQIERALNEAIEAETVAATSTSRPGRLAANSTSAAAKNIKGIISTAKAKVGAIATLNYLNMKNYRQAAERCLKIDFDHFYYPSLLATKDVALCGTVCALATFSRSELKDKVLGSLAFHKFLENEPKLIEILQNFVKSQFGICFDILDEIKDHLLLNMHIWSHVKELYNLIRRRAIILYFTPYAVADMEKMAMIFRVHVDELENELFLLIEKNEIFARIDSFHKKLYSKNEEEVRTSYNGILEAGDIMSDNIMDILLRAALYRSQIIVGVSDNGTRSRRRPLQGSTIDDLLEH
ncbi:unnamed protein product [Thelazia callipaeda]|uniref:PCI domain-containing protein n=1 Tax=Thelazia callipaeda TaxID=103827 RepID=A0A0N5D7L2_THECL|nr:unnamed protein product [Thelazia callipaeda]